MNRHDAVDIRSAATKGFQVTHNGTIVTTGLLIKLGRLGCSEIFARVLVNLCARRQ
jgi:hypothetical protein